MFVLVIALCASIDGKIACISQAVPEPIIERRLCETVKEPAISGAIKGASDAGAQVFWSDAWCVSIGVTG